MITAAALCPSPPLLMSPLNGAEPVLPELRQACLDLVGELLAAGPDVVAVAGAGEETTRWPPGSASGLAPFAPGAGLGPGALPSAVLAGCWLLDKSGYRGERLLLSVDCAESVAGCARIGAG